MPLLRWHLGPGLHDFDTAGSFEIGQEVEGKVVKQTRQNLRVDLGGLEAAGGMGAECVFRTPLSVCQFLVQIMLVDGLGREPFGLSLDLQHKRTRIALKQDMALIWSNPNPPVGCRRTRYSAFNHFCACWI